MWHVIWLAESAMQTARRMQLGDSRAYYEIGLNTNLHLVPQWQEVPVRNAAEQSDLVFESRSIESI
jgi:hypothetical protein